MSFIYQDLRDRERTCIKEKVKSRSKYTCSEIPHDPVERTVQLEVTEIALLMRRRNNLGSETF